MVEKISKNKISLGQHWCERHSKEVTLRLALGQTHGTIARAIGFKTDTVRARIKRDRLKRALSKAERFQLSLEIEQDRLLEGLLSEAPGTPRHARLSAAHIAAQTARSGVASDETEKEGQMILGEMSDDELRTYVASLVPGLEG